MSGLPKSLAAGAEERCKLLRDTAGLYTQFDDGRLRASNILLRAALFRTNIHIYTHTPTHTNNSLCMEQ